MQHDSRLVGGAQRLRSRRPHVSPRLALAAVLLAGCTGGSGAEAVDGGETVVGPSSFFFTESNFGGAANAVRLLTAQYGRIVQLVGLDADGRRIPMGDDFVVRASLRSDDVDYVLEVNAVTGQEILLVPRNVDDPAERAEFLSLVRAAGDDLDTLLVRDLGASLVSMVPRNAAIVLRFDDLLVAATIDATTVQLVTGLPPSLPFECRVRPSAYFGGRTADGRFHPTRVVFDLTTSPLEASAGSGGPLQVNAVGLPPSLSASDINGQVRIATRTHPAVGITKVLTNLAGKPLATTSNGPVDLVAITRPVTRAFRSGGRADVVEDPFNGFLRDEIPPVLVGSTPIALTERPVQIDGAGSNLFRLPTVEFASPTCASAPRVGDIIVQGDVVAEIAADAPPPSEGASRDVLVRLIVQPSFWSGPADWEVFGLGPASYESAFDAAEDAARAGCFIGIDPRPTGFPDLPTTGIRTGSRVSLRFSEPMESRSLTAFDSVLLTRAPIPEFGGLATSDLVVGRLVQSADARDVTFVPDQPLAHQQGVAEDYYVTVASEIDAFPPQDLAGNAVAGLPSIELRVEPGEETQLNGGRVSRFTTPDEEAPFGGRPEWSGQLLFDGLRQLIRPRPIVRSQVVIDDEQATVQQMTPFPQGVVTPFSPFGSKMQAIWRYADCGFSLSDQQNANIDVEGLNWAPVSGAVTPDEFDSFEMRLAHSKFAPDEAINPTNLFPMFELSGLRPRFTNNVLQGTAASVVHPRERGYVIDSGDLFLTNTGTTLLPFPLNRDVDPAERTYFTWRDTAIRERGGPQTSGADPQAYLLALGLTPPLRPYFRANNIQTIGLPLLMEFRTFPDSSAIGTNGWILSLAVNSSARPNFRNFSTGGTNQGGAFDPVDPDTEEIGNGGFDPNSSPPGATTIGRDNSVHIGAIDYVTRISRVHSIWFEPTIEGEPSFTTRRYNPPTVEPRAADQPAGTGLDIDFRGATDIVYNDSQTFPDDNDTDDNGVVDYRENAFLLDLYGDFYNEVDGPLSHDRSAMNPGLEFQGSETLQPWRESVDEIADARFYQVRVSFLGNAATGQTAELSAFAMTWSR
ncbi:MAG: Ig-like domain-containing protein [Planctomycetota bacterium]